VPDPSGDNRTIDVRAIDVLAIGNAIVDVLTMTDDAFLDAHRLVKGSMQLVDADQAEALYAAMGSGTETSGGSAANTAVGVASLGGRAAFVGKVRDDQLGAVYVHDLNAIGVAFTVATAPASHAEPTGRCLVLVTPDGERTMNTHLGIAALVTVDDIDPDLVAAAQVVFAEGYLWDSPSAQEAILRAIELAKGSGTQVGFSLSDGFCVDRHREAFLELVEGHVDILFANEAEICSLHETTSFEEAVAATNTMVPLAFLTRSERGSLVVAGDEIHAVEAAPVAAVVDTTGAGDLYAAGALFGLTNGADLPTCARLGSLAAGEVLGHLGPRPLHDLRALADEAGLLP
jgi:sugar/nucleoside kinase (ribokinase family)